MSLLTDVATYLVDQGIGTIYDGDSGEIFLSQYPDTPDKLICLFEHPGPRSQFTMGESGTPVVEGASLQIINRDWKYSDTEATARSIYEKLVGANNTELSGHRYYRFDPVASPVMLERDETRRVSFVSNYEVSRLWV